jgi:NAD dependent epimerase/dehydratase family enzyme
VHFSLITRTGAGKLNGGNVRLSVLQPPLGMSQLGRGPVNVVSSHPVTNAEFTKTLGRVLKRPTIFPMPAFAARLVFGQMGDELLLGSQRVEPAKLKASGYVFQKPDLRKALEDILKT